MLHPQHLCHHPDSLRKDKWSAPFGILLQATEEISPNIAQSTANVVNAIKPWHRDPSHGHVTNMALINDNIFDSRWYKLPTAKLLLVTESINFPQEIPFKQKMLTQFEKATCKECHQKSRRQTRLQYWNWIFSKLLILWPLLRLPSGPWHLVYAQTKCVIMHFLYRSTLTSVYYHICKLIYSKYTIYYYIVDGTVARCSKKLLKIE